MRKNPSGFALQPSTEKRWKSTKEDSHNHHRSVTRIPQLELVDALTSLINDNKRAAHLYRHRY
jgi:hypothetical protein